MNVNKVAIMCTTNFTMDSAQRPHSNMLYLPTTSDQLSQMGSKARLHVRFHITDTLLECTRQPSGVASVILRLPCYTVFDGAKLASQNDRVYVISLVHPALCYCSFSSSQSWTAKSTIKLRAKAAADKLGY